MAKNSRGRRAPSEGRALRAVADDHDHGDGGGDHDQHQHHHHHFSGRGERERGGAPFRCWCARDDGSRRPTACDGPGDEHDHHAHHDSRGLAQHLRLYYDHQWAEELLDFYGVEIVLFKLDYCAERYGLFFELERPRRRSGPVELESPREPQYVIECPAAYITALVRQEHQRRQRQEARQALAGPPHEQWLPRILNGGAARGAS